MKRRWLLIESGGGQTRKVALTQPVCQLGRGEDVTIRLESKRVSQRHATLFCKPELVTLVDQDSTNGTFVNGVKIKTRDLKSGDRIQLADESFLFQEEAAEAAPPGRETTEYGDVLDAGARRLEAWYGLVERVMGYTGKSAVLRAVLQELRQWLDLDICGVYLAADKMFYVLEGGELLEEPATESISLSLVEQVMRNQQPVFLDHIGQNEQTAGFKTLLKFKIMSLLCFPVQRPSQGAVGALYCISRQSGQLRLLEKDRRFIQACSALASLALASLELASLARGQEKQKQEEHFFPVIQRLQQENENLSLRNPD